MNVGDRVVRVKDSIGFWREKCRVRGLDERGVYVVSRVFITTISLKEFGSIRFSKDEFALAAPYAINMEDFL